MSLNKCILIGNCAEPEIISTENGTIAKFGLAINESYKNKQGEKVEQTEWVNIVCFGKVAEIVEKYVKKGALLYIEGQIKTSSWSDKEGNKRYSTEVVLNGFNSTLKMLGGKSESQQSEAKPVDDLPY